MSILTITPDYSLGSVIKQEGDPNIHPDIPFRDKASGMRVRVKGVDWEASWRKTWCGVGDQEGRDVSQVPPRATWTSPKFWAQGRVNSEMS